MKTGKMAFDIPEPTKKGACRHSCPLARIERNLTLKDDYIIGYDEVLFCKFALNSGALFPRPVPGPQCIWGRKPSRRTTKGTKR